MSRIYNVINGNSQKLFYNNYLQNNNYEKYCIVIYYTLVNWIHFHNQLALQQFFEVFNDVSAKKCYGKSAVNEAMQAGRARRLSRFVICGKISLKLVDMHTA